MVNNNKSKISHYPSWLFFIRSMVLLLVAEVVIEIFSLFISDVETMLIVSKVIFYLVYAIFLFFLIKWRNAYKK